METIREEWLHFECGNNSNNMFLHIAPKLVSLQPQVRRGEVHIVFPKVLETHDSLD